MNYDYLFKILLIGDSSTGKSSILTVYTDQIFNETFMSTIGVDFKIKTIQIDNRDVKLQIWDTAGQERFRTITTSYYRGVHGIFAVFDLSDRISFRNITNWLDEIARYAPENVPIILIGNKSDLPREISEIDAKKFADERNLIYFETSAKKNININESFDRMCNILVKKHAELNKNKKQDISKINIEKVQNNDTTLNNPNNSCC